MTGYFQWVLIFVISVFNFCLDANPQIGANKDVMESTGDFEGFLRDLGTKVYKVKTPTSEIGSGQNFELPIMTTPKVYQNYELITQKAALNDALMLKLVSYYEDKYKLVRNEPTTERIKYPDMAYNSYRNKNHYEAKFSAEINNAQIKNNISRTHASKSSYSETKPTENIEDRVPDIEAMLDDSTFVVGKRHSENSCNDNHRPSSANKSFHKAHSRTGEKPLHYADNNKIMNEQPNELRKINHRAHNLEKVYSEDAKESVNERAVNKKYKYRRPNVEKVYDEFEHRMSAVIPSHNINSNPKYFPKQYKKIPDEFDRSSNVMMDIRPTKSDKVNEKINSKIDDMAKDDKTSEKHLESGFTSGRDTGSRAVEEILDNIVNVSDQYEIMQYYDLENDKPGPGEEVDFDAPEIAVL